MFDRASEGRSTRILYMIPIIGYLLRCIEEERSDELLLLIANFFMLVVFGVMIWGYPALIATMLTLAGLTASFVLYITLE